MLMEPDKKVRYGSKTTLTISVPNKDLDFFRELASRMGWEEE